MVADTGSSRVSTPVDLEESVRSVIFANGSTGAGRGMSQVVTDRVSTRTPPTVRLSAFGVVPFAGVPIFPASGDEEELEPVPFGAAAAAAAGEDRRVSCARPLPLSSGVVDGCGWVKAGMESSSKSSSSSSGPGAGDVSGSGGRGGSE